MIDQHATQSAALAVHRIIMEEDEKLGDFVAEGEVDAGKGVTRSGNMRLPKYAPPQPFDGMQDKTKSFISSVVLYILGCCPEFHTAESKIMFALSYIRGGKAQFWKDEAISEIIAGHKPFRNFHGFLIKLEAQFGDPNPDTMAKGKLKVMHQGGKTASEFILEFKSEASRSNLGDIVLIEYFKAGLNQSLFKAIY
jgi:Retrotransposon gag protein